MVEGWKSHRRTMGWERHRACLVATGVKFGEVYVGERYRLVEGWRCNWRIMVWVGRLS